MKTPKEPQESFLLRLNKSLKDKATSKATKDNRSLNKHIVHIITKDLEK